MVLGTMKGLYGFLEFTTEAEEDFAGSWLPTLDTKLRVMPVFTLRLSLGQDLGDSGCFLVNKNGQYFGSSFIPANRFLSNIYIEL